MISAQQFYIDSFIDTGITLGADPQHQAQAPGAYGWLTEPDSPGSPGRLLIVDDSAEAWLREHEQLLATCAVTLAAAAPRCTAVLEALEHVREDAEAMIYRDLGAIPAFELPDGLTALPVRRAGEDLPAGSVPLETAAAACVAAGGAPPGMDSSQLAELLQHGLPAASSVIAAVGDHDVVRGTAAGTAIGTHCAVMFVSTDPAWRGRGVATAMTARVLRAAASTGARTACLEATLAGRSIYRWLGFEDAGPVAVFIPTLRS